MFPAQIAQAGPADSLRCRDSGQFVGDGPHSRDKNSRADTTLTQEIYDALWELPTVRALDYSNIDIRARNGMVSLYGHVVSEANRQHIEQAVRSVDGIVGIGNYLVADDRLLVEVATALGSLEHAYDCKFFTGVSHGVVLLSGTVDDPTTSRLAEQCAATNPNVRAVINSLRVRSGGPTQPDAPFLQPAIGTEVFFLDGVSGWVQQVIVDPENRRVTAFTLQPRFADQEQDLRPQESVRSHRLEGTLLIPLKTVRHLTKSSGFLNIRSDEHEQYSAADPADFMSPEENWRPPYPYCSGDVQFQAGQAAAATAIPVQEESLIEVALAHQVLKDQMLENDSLGG